MNAPATAPTAPGHGDTSVRKARILIMSDGYVYVVECGGYYKIGYSAYSPRKRILTMQTGNPLPIRFIGAIPGSMINEAEWHEVFAAKRVRGEWFDLTSTDIAYILNEEAEFITLPPDDHIA